MADLVIDFNLLSQAANQLNSLEYEIDILRSVNGFIFDGSQTATGGSSSVLGPGGLGSALANFCGRWSHPMFKAGVQVGELGGNLTAVAQNFQALDTEVALAINVNRATDRLAAIARQTDSGTSSAG